MRLPRLREWLEQGPFTLTLSSGFFGFYAHTGMLYALIEAGFVPARASGSSAGALVAGAWAAGVEPAVLDDRLRRLSREDFWDPGFGPGYLRGARFRSLLDELLPVRTFAECRVPLRLSVFDLRELRTRSIDSGELALAIAASCTVPLMFQPVRDRGRWLIDGGMLDRPGLLGVPRDARVLYHHLPSRVPSARLRRALGRVPPRRAGLVAVTLEHLPRADPFHLEAGKSALERARRDMHVALERPIEHANVCV
jgi:NTE family protein